MRVFFSPTTLHLVGIGKLRSVIYNFLETNELCLAAPIELSTESLGGMMASDVVLITLGPDLISFFRTESGMPSGHERITCNAVR